MEIYDVFLSYRRDGGDSLAQLLYDRLTKEGYKVFMDVESLRSGKFNDALYSVIEHCKDVLLVLPEGGLERCQDETDWVRLEIEHALEYNKNIIPIMMRNFEFPNNMPQTLQNLKFYNGVVANMDYFDGVLSKIKAMLHSSPKIDLYKKNSMSISEALVSVGFLIFGLCFLFVIMLWLFPKLGKYLNINTGNIEHFIDEVFFAETKSIIMLIIAIFTGYLIYKYATYMDFGFYLNKNKEKNIDMQDIELGCKPLITKILSLENMQDVTKSACDDKTGSFKEFKLHKNFSNIIHIGSMDGDTVDYLSVNYLTKKVCCDVFFLNKYTTSKRAVEFMCKQGFNFEKDENNIIYFSYTDYKILLFYTGFRRNLVGLEIINNNLNSLLQETFEEDYKQTLYKILEEIEDDIHNTPKKRFSKNERVILISIAILLSIMLIIGVILICCGM